MIIVPLAPPDLGEISNIYLVETILMRVRSEVKIQSSFRLSIQRILLIEAMQCYPFQQPLDVPTLLSITDLSIYVTYWSGINAYKRFPTA